MGKRTNGKAKFHQQGAQARNAQRQERRPAKIRRALRVLQNVAPSSAAAAADLAAATEATLSTPF